MRTFLLFIGIGVFATTTIAGQRIVVPDMARSIQNALDQAHNTDTIFVRNGTYRERLTLREDIALIGEHWQKTVISGNGRDPVIRAADRALIKNLTIKNGGRGILCENTVPVIDHCIITNNKKSGIQCIISLPTIVNSIIYDNDWTGIYCESSNGFKTTIDHCVIARNRYCGIMLAGNSDVLIHNTIFFDNRQYAVFFGLNSQRSRVEYNDFYFNRKLTNRQGALSATNIALDPQFPLAGIDSYDFTRAQAAALTSAGYGGSAIGLDEETVLPLNLPDQDAAPDSALPQAPSAPTPAPADSGNK